MRTPRRIALLSALAIGCCSQAFAGTVVCGGTITYLAYHAGAAVGSNGLMIQLSSMNTPVFFCNPDSTWTVSGTGYITPPSTCKTIYATLLTAQAQGKTIAGMYFDGDQAPATCDAWATWQVANIRYFYVGQ